MRKNDEVVVEITALTGGGSGIGRVDNLAVFVDQTAVGDVVKVHIIKVKKGYAIGKVCEMITPSSSRQEVDCHVFSKCGGCVFRHITYETECAVKEQAVADAIQRIGGIAKAPAALIKSPNIFGYRNKAQYPIAMGKEGISYGFYARHSHRVVESCRCALQPPIFDTVMQTVKRWADTYGITAYDETTGRGLLRHLLLRLGETTDEVMVVPVINGKELPNAIELIAALQAVLGNRLCSLQVNINQRDTNVILGEKNILLFGRETIRDTICGVSVEISPHSFYQVNRAAAEVLYQKASSYIDNNDRVLLDLFCGIGTIGLSLLSLCGNEGRKLYGVEVVEQAVKNAEQNAKSGGFSDCHFMVGDATKVASQWKKEGIRPDVIVVDPPRKGCDADLLTTITKGFFPKKLIYISCDPATLARDSKQLVAEGYKLQEYTPVDLFPGTAHVETVALFVRMDENSRRI